MIAVVAGAWTGLGTAALIVAFCVAAPLTVRHHDKKKAKR